MITEVLLVDDHGGFRVLVRGLVGDEKDMKVVGEASDGLSGVRLSCELAPHVVLMDVAMPGLGGIEATGLIMAANPSIRVIALSMHSDERFVDAMLDAGAVGYVLKDRATREIMEAIRWVVAGKMYRGSGLSQGG